MGPKFQELIFLFQKIKHIFDVFNIDTMDINIIPYCRQHHDGEAKSIHKFINLMKCWLKLKDKYQEICNVSPMVDILAITMNLLSAG